jgi:ABC-type transport system substrate-binding protein
VDDTSGIPDWTAQVNDALTTTDRTAQALKWQTLNKDAVEQAWIIPLFFSLSQNIAGTNVGGVYRWTPYSSWPYAQLYAKSTG